MHPVLFKIGTVAVYTYGVAVAVAFCTAAFFIWRNAPSYGVDRSKILDLLIWILISGVLGARILHVLANIPYYKTFPREVFNISGGGLAFHGAFFLALAAAIWFMKKNGLPFYKTMDLIAPYLALAQAIGRLGCFMNGCCWGKPNPLGLISPVDRFLRHPTQLYSALGLLFIFCLLRLLSRTKIFDGGIFLSYALLYSVFRFFMDFLRDDVPRYWMSLTLPQYISVVIFLAALLCAVKKKSLWKNTPSA